MMKRIKVLLLIATVFSLTAFTEGDKIKILLIGDSTTIGNIPRKINPEAPQLEKMIEILLNMEGDLPPVEVINLGKGGETAKRLLENGRYDKEIANIKDVDYIFVRLGINDWFHCENLKKEFPEQLKTVLDLLKKDHPEAKIFPSTICRFMSHNKCEDVNRLIYKTAKEENLELFDLYPAYHKFLLENGENSLNVRNCELNKIPEKYHTMLESYVHVDWKKREMVQINDIHLDPILGHLDGWYSDHHPNTTGYNLIADETVKFLAPIIRNDLKEDKNIDI